MGGVPPDGFKTAADGRSVFYPWGNLRKQGYLFASEKAARRFRIQINIYIAISLALISVAFGWRRFPVAAAAGGASVVLYCVWMSLIIRGLEPYDPSGGSS